MSTGASRKTVRVEMPIISLVCPECQKEDDHANIFSPSEGTCVLAEAETFCHHCETWFDVILEP